LNAKASLFDASVWMALAFESHPHHAEARRAFAAADSSRPIVFCRATQQAFLRLVTTTVVQKAYGSPAISNDEAWKKWELLMSLPQVTWLDEPEELETVWSQYARLRSSSPKVWMDGYLAAFARGHGVALVTLDKDFTRFGGLSVEYLLAQAGS
jgi:toxin-antitoxin system PIN domain toxin